MGFPPPVRFAPIDTVRDHSLPNSPKRRLENGDGERTEEGSPDISSFQV